MERHLISLGILIFIGLLLSITNAYKFKDLRDSKKVVHGIILNKSKDFHKISGQRVVGRSHTAEKVEELDDSLGNVGNSTTGIHRGRQNDRPKTIRKPINGRRVLGRPTNDFKVKEMDDSLGVRQQPMPSILKPVVKGRSIIRAKSKGMSGRRVLGKEMQENQAVEIELDDSLGDQMGGVGTSEIQLGTKGRAIIPGGNSTKDETPRIFNQTEPENADLDELLESVADVDCPDCKPGLMAVYGFDAFPILTAIPMWQEGSLAPVASAANFERGRVVAFADESFMTNLAGNILLNSINWASRSAYESMSAVPKKRAGVLGEVCKSKPLAKFLHSNGYDVKFIQHEILMNSSAFENELDVLILLDMNLIKMEVMENLKNYVKDGGGVVAACGQISDDFQGNEFLRESGMVWVAHPSKPGINANKFNASKQLLQDMHGGHVATNIMNCIKSGEVIEKVRMAQMKATLLRNLLFVNNSDIPWILDLKESLMTMTPINAHQGNKIKSTTQSRFNVTLQMLLFDILGPKEMTAHPSSIYFPGAVDSKTLENNPKNHTILIPLNKGETKSELIARNYGHSTGLYAPPGARISMNIQAEGDIKFEVKIGCHTDDLRWKPNWVRFPYVVMTQSFSGNSADLASPFGGLIYIQGLKIGVPIVNVTIDVTGAISTPSFVLGQTQLRDWKDSIRNTTAPFAEFVSDRAIISIPGRIAQTVEDPEELMMFWREVINHMSDFVGVPQEKNVQRFVFDVDISMGFLHSGYPIMGYLQTAKDAGKIDFLRKMYSWGFYHEIGHNLQRHEWTMEGDEEVTCNIFAMYILNTLCRIPMEETREVLFPKKLRPLIEKFIANNDTYLNRKEDVRLVFYYQLQKIFGWGAFKRVFKSYQGQAGVSNKDKPDKWLFMFSTTVRMNMADLFKSWGIPITPEGEAKVAHLPASGYKVSSLLE